MHKSWNMLEDLLYPPRCPVCDGVVAVWNKGICEICLKKIRYVKPPRCMKCGKHMEEQEEEFCKDCRERSHYYKEGRALYHYKEVAVSLYRFKYQGRREYAAVFAEEFIYYLEEAIRRWNPDALIPVPLYSVKERRRGYNQAGILAKELGKRLNIPVYDDFVRRIKNTKPLKMLNPEERLNNLKKAFILMENGVKLNRVIIVDDIYTTGSTIDTISKLFLEHGISEVYFLTVAIGEDA